MTLNRKLIVSKFGGTSLANASAIRQSAKVAKDNDASLIIVSAAGSTTDRLVELAGAFAGESAAEASQIIEELKAGHLKIAGELNVSESSRNKLNKQFEQLSELAQAIAGKDYSLVLKRLYPSTRHVYKQRLKDLRNVLGFNVKNKTALKSQTKQIYDHILAYGEQLSSVLLADAMAQLGLNVSIIDARKIIKTDDRHKYATPLTDMIKKQANKFIKTKLTENAVFVSQGFVGQAPDGSTTTLGRGGSDYSAALFAEAIGADQLQIWSDVSGVASADPKIVKNARQIPSLTFREAAELATSGAKVLYPKTITPLRRHGIPIYVGNTFKPEAKGTLIEKTNSSKPLVTAIALKKDQKLITVSSEQMAQQFGYLAKVFGIFARHKISVDQVSTSEISVSFTLDNNVSADDKLFSELKELGDISIEQGLSMVSLIGNDVNNTPGLVGRIFSCLETEQSKIAIRMISQGASKHNFCFLVENKYGEQSVIKLHKEFIEGIS